MRDAKNSELLEELVEKQLKTVPVGKKFGYDDLKRLCKYLGVSIFDENICSLWKGYVTNTKKTHKGVCINFYFNHKKIALNRLLYVNFVGELADNEYLKFSCENKGKCCNVTHLKKFKKKQKIMTETEKKQNLVVKKPVSFSLSFD